MDGRTEGKMGMAVYLCRAGAVVHADQKTPSLSFHFPLDRERVGWLVGTR